ncbi:MAG: hypothetical protein H0W84_05355 [Bacteroidetes bacterium]|nr:hypothetical protein [Bacteroidota bacterium]
MYRTNATFDFLENFENVGMIIDSTSRSLVPFEKISSPAENIFEGLNAGFAHLTDTNNFFECATVNKYSLPKSGADVFLEFNYKCNYKITVSIIAYGIASTEQFAVLGLNPSEDWNKAYVHLTPGVSGAYSALNYKIAWGTVNNNGTDSIGILLDNIKLVH